MFEYYPRRREKSIPGSLVSAKCSPFLSITDVEQKSVSLDYKKFPLVIVLLADATGCLKRHVMSTLETGV